MIIKVNKIFIKELAAIPTKEKIKIERFLFEEAEKLNAPNQIVNLNNVKDTFIITELNLKIIGQELGLTTM